MIYPKRNYEISSDSGRLISVSEFALVEYRDALAVMSDFASQRSQDEQDQIWLLQHPPVYTQGTACRQSPLTPSEIELVKTDRGGQITYHGPGQIVMYPLLNLRHFGLGVKTLVFKLEQAVIELLEELNIVGERRPDAPGVYVNQEKIAALGLRIRRGTSYHGLSLNVDMDLSPFSNIDPCGFQGLRVTQLADHLKVVDPQSIATQLLSRFVALI